MELLSPAGGREALVAAIQNGADAVYLGYTAFGARSYAGNFDKTQLREALDYAHERGRKIYVTVNTLIKPAEFTQVMELLERLNAWGADAVIVQDVGLARMARACFPDLPLHASTQMTIHNAQGAKALYDAGFTRVVPARECAFSELAHMARTGVEIEAFVHGALCVSVSGQCLFSGFAGGRSGNRGRCAQPCRLPYAMADGTRGCLLSTRDLMLIDCLDRMRDAGVYSLKIEGRMKRPEYVAVVTRAYREALDCAQSHTPYRADSRTLEELRQIFNRGGFTQGYAMGKSNAALLSWEKPNHWGVPLGSVEKVSGDMARVRLDTALSDGDGLQFQGERETDVTYSGHDTPAGGCALVRLGGKESVRAGDAVVRLTSQRQMLSARESFAGEHVSIPVTMRLRAVPGETPELTVSDGVHCAKATGNERVERAQTRALDVQGARRQMEKTGGTPYCVKELALEGENAFLSASALNALRRDGLEALKRLRCAVPERRTGAPAEMTLPAQETPQLYAQTGDLSQGAALLEAGASYVYWRPEDYRTEALDAAWREAEDRVRERTVFVLPQMTFTTELERIRAWVQAARPYGVALGNLSHLYVDWGGAVMIADAPLNVYNARSASVLFDGGVRRVTCSLELNAAEMEALGAQGGNYELIAYGRAQLMLLSHCTERVKHGETVQDGACARCVTGKPLDRTLRDRRGFAFLQQRERMEHGCFVRLYNALRTDMARRFERVRALNMSVRVCFVDETLQERIRVVQAYRALLDGKEDPRGEAREETTLGHLLRGVE